MFTWMPGDVRALPIAKWHTGSEGRWDVTIQQKLPQAWPAQPAAGLGTFGCQEQYAAGEASPDPSPSGFRFE